MHRHRLEPFLRPSEEAQALARVHRIGQRGAVEATTYYVRGSVEGRILAARRPRRGPWRPRRGGRHGEQGAFVGGLSYAPTPRGHVTSVQ